MKRMMVIIIAFFCTIYTSVAQEKKELDHSMNGKRTTNFPEFKKLVFTSIPGGNLLSQPERIDGTKYEIRTEKHGLGYPALFDWDGDGKLDLLMGEFETGKKESNIKVYLNKGTNKKPKYTGEWFYATDINGDTLTCHQWCCIGTHPQVVDIDGDGYDDIISGQYNPGKISWWRGSEKGFLPRQFIEQEGYVEGECYPGVMTWSPASNSYWNFTTARFADFNGDGLLDLFVAGSGGFRVALNKGTKEQPVLGLREYLFHVDGTILHIRRDPSVEVKTGENVNIERVCGGDGHTYIFPYDWDHDGVLDLFVHDGYTSKGGEVLYFFRGVQTDDGLRFEHAVPLFTSEDGSKALPGCAPMLTIADYNGDGVEDVLLGLSIATFNPKIGVFEGGYESVNEVNWGWIRELGLNFPGKDAGASLRYYNCMDTLNAKMKQIPYLKEYFIGKLADMRYITLRHRGYPVVLYGQKNTEKAIAKREIAQPREFLFDKEHMNDTYKSMSQEEIDRQMRKEKEGKQPTVSTYRPVDYVLKYPIRVQAGKTEFEVEVKFKVLADYHIYNNSKVNSDQVPVSITFEYPENLLSKEGNLQEPKVQEGIRVTYTGEKDESGAETFSFKQAFKVKEGIKAEKAKIVVNVVFQTCSSQTCLPPVEEKHVIEIIF